MKTIKPLQLGVLTRNYEHGQEFFLGISILSFISLGEEPSLLSEIDLWKFAAQELGKDAVIDAAIPKARPEFLLTGSACMPGVQPRGGCLVRARLGDKEKLLHVYGDRHWRGGLPTEPLPFTTMPLDWAHAYGGVGFEQNPQGKGFKPVETDGGLIHWLPNIQYPNQKSLSPEDRQEPACFGPVDLTRPQRFSKAGTHDDRWLKEDFPGFARDIDWTIFNIASPDQWFTGPLSGKETFLLENMHPAKPALTGRLPGLKVRCFVNGKTDEGEMFQEASTKLSTVWFFPHAERAILIYQTSVKVKEEDATDILQIIVAGDQADAPRTAEHYREVLRQRLDEKKGYLYSLRDSDLIAPVFYRVEASPLADISSVTGEGLLQKNARKMAALEIENARALAAGFGLDPDVHVPRLPLPEEPLPDFDQLPEYLEKIEAEAERQKTRGKEAVTRNTERLEELFASLGMDFNVVRKEFETKPSGPPAFSAQTQINNLRELAKTAREQGAPAIEIENYLADSGFIARLVEGEKDLRDAYRMSAHDQDPVPSIGTEKALLMRHAVQAAYDKGGDLTSVDLTGADLSMMDLHGANLEGSFLDTANLSGCNLSGCNLRNTVLAHADLSNAQLVNADLEGANMGAALLADADLKKANLKNANLTRADLTGADFTGAKMEHVNCSESRFKGTNFSYVEAVQIIILEGSMEGLVMAGANLTQALFLKVDATGVDFTGATLTSALFLESKAMGARFDNADMTNVRVVQECSFDEASFVNACLKKANLRGCSLKGSDFTGAQLDNADLSQCTLHKARFYRAFARETQFVKADLTEAVMTSVNAMNASFRRADIRGTDFRGANLFQVDLARVFADKTTDLTDALTKKASVYPRRRA